MPAIRTLAVFLPAAVITLLISTPFIVQHALATPISVPSSSGARLANLSVRTNRSPAPRYLVSHATVAVTTKSLRALSGITAGDTEHKASRSVPHSPRELVPTSARTPRSPDASSDKVALLQIYYQQALQHAANYQNLASYATSASATNPVFRQQNASTSLLGFSTNLQDFTTVLAELGADKGTANLDRTNDLEVLLKNIVNANKDVLTVTYDLVDSLPVVGPILGPIVYEIKCILDDLLDTVENLSDATINAIQPLLQVVLGKAITATCRSGVQVVGLCI